MAENIDLEYLADLMRRIRKERGNTLQEVANEVGVSIPTLSRIERGEAKGVEAETLLALTQWLKVPAEQLREKHLSETRETTGRATLASTPDIIELHLRADPNLNPKTAKALATMFRIAYEQMAQQKTKRPTR
jgi:transcriptional regulator with XRE-family HTH domain